MGGIFREVLDGDTVPRHRYGGSGLTAAIVSARLAARTTLVSYVGDEDAEAVGTMLAAAGIDATSLIKLPGASGTFVFPNDPTKVWPMYRPAEAVPDAVPNVVAARVYLVFGMPDFDPVVAGWLDRVPTHAVLIWDRQGWISRARDWRAISSVRIESKVYVANLDEAFAEFGTSTYESLITSLPPPGYQAAIVKQGPDGCTVIDRIPSGSAHLRIPAFNVEVQGTIGSGDAFAGGLASKLSHGGTMHEAAVVANAAAAAYLELSCDPLAENLAEQTRLMASDRRLT